MWNGTQKKTTSNRPHCGRIINVTSKTIIILNFEKKNETTNPIRCMKRDEQRTIIIDAHFINLNF